MFLASKIKTSPTRLFFRLNSLLRSMVMKMERRSERKGHFRFLYWSAWSLWRFDSRELISKNIYAYGKQLPAINKSNLCLVKNPYRKKRIDTFAILFILALALVTSIVLFPFISTCIISYLASIESDFTAGAGGAAVGMLLKMLYVFVSPVWICLRFYFRKKLDWPRDAFKETSRASE